MKKIIIKGEEFSYQVFSDCDEYNGCYSWTEFFQGTKTTTRKKYWLFGPIVTETEPKFMFKVGFNIEGPNRTKEELRTRLEREVDILHRAEEIARGEII